MEAPNSSCPLLSKLIPPNQHSVAFTSTFSFLYSVIRCSFASLLSKSKAPGTIFYKLQSCILCGCLRRCSKMLTYTLNSFRDKYYSSFVTSFYCLILSFQCLQSNSFHKGTFLSPWITF